MNTRVLDRFVDRMSSTSYFQMTYSPHRSPGTQGSGQVDLEDTEVR